MKRSRFSEEQIIKILKAAEGGVPVEDLSRQHGFSERRCTPGGESMEGLMWTTRSA